MEATPAINLQVTESPDEELLSSSSSASSQEELSLIIARLIHLKQPIFVVAEEKHSQKNEEFEKQEMLKLRILSYNRKEKSLEELSKKFISHFEGRDGLLLELDKVTLCFRVERRRIYDIVNIFESLKVVKKAAKNNYVWRGLKSAIQTINHMLLKGKDHEVTTKRQKSLENLAARFLKLFIFSSAPISLDEAAQVLMHTQDSALVKTKVRRLYDIVNVFKSIGLVQKGRLLSKKTGFEWKGVKKLQDIIALKKNQWKDVVTPNEGMEQKENNQELTNRQNVNSWFSNEDHRRFLELGVLKKYSQKTFQPEILRGEAASTLQQSLTSPSDIYTEK